jgi:hypothetical protein
LAEAVEYRLLAVLVWGEHGQLPVRVGPIGP